VDRADMTMRHPALGPDEHLPQRPVLHRHLVIPAKAGIFLVFTDASKAVRSQLSLG
jgi:hypothetical protein